MKPTASPIQKSPHNSEPASASFLVTVLLLAAFALLPCVVAAQALYGTLTGTVNDQSGAVVPNVAITITSQDTGAVRTTTTGARETIWCPTCFRAPTASLCSRRALRVTRRRTFSSSQPPGAH